jgi:hypothetical protein
MPGAPEDGAGEPTERCRYGCDGYFANRTAGRGFIPATGEPQADAFEKGAHLCSMVLWVLV